MLKIEDASKPYQALLKCVTSMLQQLLKDLDLLQKQQIIVPLGADEISEWCNSFILVPTPNWKVQLCLVLVRPNQALIRPVYRGSTGIDILFLIIIYVNLGYHSLNLNK